MILNAKRFLILAFAPFLLVSCSGGGGHAHHAGSPLFKGRVVSIQYQTTRGITLLTDADGKTLELHGLHGVPLTDVEIYAHGDHGLLIYRLPKS